MFGTGWYSGTARVVIRIADAVASAAAGCCARRGRAGSPSSTEPVIERGSTRVLLCLSARARCARREYSADDTAVASLRWYSLGTPCTCCVAGALVMGGSPGGGVSVSV